jgi:hypothetical protein
MSDCGNTDVRDQLPDLVNGSLPPAARAAVEAHVRACADCAAEVALLRTAHAVLRQGPAVDVGAIARAVRSARRPAPMPRWRAARWARVAAAVLVVAAAGSVAVVGVRQGGSGTERVATRAPGVTGPAPRGNAPGLGAPTTAPSGGAGAELALAAGVQFLSESELETLLVDIEDLDVVPSDEPQPLLPALLDDGGAL